jgi:hypothetical protein
MKTSAILAVLTIVLAACGGSAAPTQQPGQATNQPGQPTPAGPTSPPVIGGAGTSIVHLVVASGPLAGTYDKTGPKSDCNISPTGSGATFGDVSATEGLTSLIFTSIEGGASPAKFYFQVIFGTYPDSQDLEVQIFDPATASGTGTAALQDNGATIKWTFNGTTADGIGVQATVECGPVDRQ